MINRIQKALNAIKKLRSDQTLFKKIKEELLK